MDERVRKEVVRATDRGRDNLALELGLAELTDLAGVSVRTVRYYIAEGLLPPPVGAGPRALYTAAHLDRLRLIGRLKEAYLPLREIRHRLGNLDDEEVRALLGDIPAAEPPDGNADHRTPPAPDDSAAAYLARLLPRTSARSRDDLARRASVGFAGRMAEQSGAPDISPPTPGDPFDAVANPSSLTRADLERGAALAALSAQAPFPSDMAADTWRRIGLGDDAELLIRADAYGRQREQIDALVAWARRILG